MQITCRYGQEGLSRDQETILKVGGCSEFAKCRGGFEEKIIFCVGKLHFITRTMSLHACRAYCVMRYVQCVHSCDRQSKGTETQMLSDNWKPGCKSL